MKQWTKFVKIWDHLRPVSTVKTIILWYSIVVKLHKRVGRNLKILICRFISILDYYFRACRRCFPANLSVQAWEAQRSSTKFENCGLIFLRLPPNRVQQIHIQTQSEVNTQRRRQASSDKQTNTNKNSILVSLRSIDHNRNSIYRGRGEGSKYRQKENISSRYWVLYCLVAPSLFKTW